MAFVFWIDGNPYARPCFPKPRCDARYGLFVPLNFIASSHLWFPDLICAVQSTPLRLYFDGVKSATLHVTKAVSSCRDEPIKKTLTLIFGRKCCCFKSGGKLSFVPVNLERLL